MVNKQMMAGRSLNSVIACHRIPERCFKIKGEPMQMCARCLGASIGHIAALLLFIFDYLPNIFLSFSFMGIMLIDWSLQFFKIQYSTNPRRFITGILGGIGVGSCQWSLLGFGVKWLTKIFA